MMGAEKLLGRVMLSEAKHPCICSTEQMLRFFVVSMRGIETPQN